MPGSLVVRRAWALPLWSHALLLVVILVAAAPFLRLSEAFTIDEGAYAIQARDLDRGRWAFDYQAEAVDSQGRWLPLYHPTRGVFHWYAYVKQPAYPLALLAATRVMGDVVGLHVLAMAGALGVAVAAWLLASEVDPRSGRGAFWIAAGSPVAVNAYVIWAHAPSAAVAGFAMVAGLRLVRTPRPVWALLLLAYAGGGVLLRAEGLLFAVALALGLFVVGLRGHPWVLRAGIPVACAAAAAGAAALNALWRGAIAGASIPVQGLRAEEGAPALAGGGAGESWRHWASGRLDGAWSSLFQGSLGDTRGGARLAAALVTLCFAAWVAHRRRAVWQRDVAVALAAAALLYALRMAAGGTQPMTGLFAAWPVALLGLALVPQRALRDRAVGLLVSVVSVFLIAVLATQYEIGGGREWGGRFFFPALVPVAVLASLGLRHLLLDWRRARGVPVLLVAALVVLPTLTGFSVLRANRGQLAAIVNEVTAPGPGLVATDVRGLPPFAWKTYPRVGWMATRSEDLVEATARLREAGVARVTVLGPGTLSSADLTAYPMVDEITGPEARKRGWRTFRLSVGP